MRVCTAAKKYLAALSFSGATLALLFLMVVSARAAGTSKLFYYGSVAGFDYSAASQDPFSYYYIKGAIFDPYSRLGVGIALQENNLGPKSDLIGTSGLSSGHTWSVSKLFPVTLFFVPSITKTTYTGPLSGRNIYNLFYLYSTFASAAALPDWSDSGAIAKGNSFEGGLGYSIAGLLDLRAGYKSLKIPTSRRDYLFPGYKENNFFVSIGVSLGFLFVPDAMKSGEYLGFIPWIKNPIENARIARENANPVISSYSPDKPVVGSSFEISGSNFRADENETSVLFGDSSGELTSLSDKRILVRIPGSIQPGYINVRVKTSKGYSEQESVFVLPAKPPSLTVKLNDFNGSAGDKALHAGESGKISFTIANAKGAGKAFGLGLIPTVDGSQKSELEFTKYVDIGDLDGGGSRQVVLPISAGLGLKTGEQIFNMRITEANSFWPDPFKVRIQTKRLEPPDLRLSGLKINGKNANVVQQGRLEKISLTLVNNGTGPTKDTKVQVLSESTDIVFMDQAAFSVFAFGNIPPGDRQDLEIAFAINKKYEGLNSLPIKLVISDSRDLFNKELPLGLKLKRSASAMPDPVSYKIEEVGIQSGANIAVVDFVANNVFQADADAVTAIFRTELVSAKKFRVVVGGNTREAILAEQRLQSSGYTTPESAMEVGKLLNAKQILFGTLSMIGDTYNITVDVVDGETGKIIASYDENVGDPAKFKAACKKIVGRLVQ